MALNGGTSAVSESADPNALRGESEQTRGRQTLLLELDLGGQAPGTSRTNGLKICLDDNVLKFDNVL
jgi:hypothetical protein